jgi:hypothetical protein
MKRMKLNTGQLRGSDIGVRISYAGHRRGDSICEHCMAEASCTIKEDSPQLACGVFVAPLTFSNTKGLAGQFSTIRLGGAWPRRLSPNDIVGMINPKSLEVLGFARVLSADEYPRDMAIKKAAVRNHAVRHKRKGKQKALAKIMRDVYGTIALDMDKTWSNIELERLTDDEAKRLQAAWPMD